jgi:hypothetical protein
MMPNSTSGLPAMLIFSVNQIEPDGTDRRNKFQI